MEDLRSHMENRKARILIIDDHPIFREALKGVIEGSRRYKVVGEAGSSHHGLELAKGLKPDLLLLDISLPDQSGLDIIRDIIRISSKTRILMLSMHSKTEYIIRAFRAGARGYVVKESPPKKILEGIDEVLKGDYYIDTSISRKVIKKLVKLSSNTLTTGVNSDVLSHREREVLALLAQGLSPVQIAKKLFISPKTVENHRSSIMRKLNCHSIVELLRYSIKLGLVDTDLWMG
jgi:DNA-binding NarL/FixJ family response regulator